MNDSDFELCIDAIARVEKKYSKQAYVFVLAGLGLLIKSKFQDAGMSFSVSGVSGALSPSEKIDHNEALHWLKIYGWRQYGMLAKNVFNKWGLKRSGDFLEIIQILLRYKMIEKTYMRSKYSDSYVVAGFDFSDYSREDFFAMYESV